MRLRARSSSASTLDHFVEFYENDETILSSAVTFLANALAQGGGAIAITEASHGEALATALARRIDLATARAERRYLALDAEETLSRFMDGDVPDPERFEAVLRDVMGRVEARGGLRIFGEMVGVLCNEGRTLSAVGLEDLWDNAVLRHRFRLFCAYPTQALAGTDVADIDAICTRHTHVVMPSPSTV